MLFNTCVVQVLFFFHTALAGYIGVIRPKANISAYTYVGENGTQLSTHGTSPDALNNFVRSIIFLRIVYAHQIYISGQSSR
jgi:hypothetical protein